MSKNKDLATVWAAYRKAKGMPEAKAVVEQVEDDFFTDVSLERLDEEEVALDDLKTEESKPDRLSQIMAKHTKVKRPNED
jgi:hypothetical protein